MDKSSFIKLFLVLAIYCCVLIGRVVYLCYVKAPKEIERLQSEGLAADVVKWQEFRDKCKIKIAVMSAIGMLMLVVFMAGI